MDWSSGIATCISQVVFSRVFDFGDNEVATPLSRRSSSSSLTHTQPAGQLTKGGGERGSGVPGGKPVHPSGAGRRKQIARCRALRTEIATFESEFESRNGRRPHAHDRESMAGVYAEYRALKAGVRDEAATHIQCVYRGFASRRKHSNLQSGDSRRDDRGSHAHEKAAPAAVGGTSISEKLAALKTEKSALKQKLRAFDAKFLTEHGRNPSKPEKEHLRPLYQRYHDLKAMISTLESAVAATSARAAPPAAVPSSSAAGRTNPPQLVHHDSAGSTSSAQAEDPDDDMTSAPAMEAIASVMGDRVDVEDDDATANKHVHGVGAKGAERSAADGGKNASQAAALKELRGEKRRLQQFLRDYERDFEAREGRKVKFVKDIQPVLDHYTRYKHLKTILKELGAA